LEAIRSRYYNDPMLGPIRDSALFKALSKLIAGHGEMGNQVLAIVQLKEGKRAFALAAMYTRCFDTWPLLAAKAQVKCTDSTSPTTGKWQGMIARLRLDARTWDMASQDCWDHVADNGLNVFDTAGNNGFKTSGGVKTAPKTYTRTRRLVTAVIDTLKSDPAAQASILGTKKKRGKGRGSPRGSGTRAPSCGGPER
jgi:hypothetical protein